MLVIEMPQTERPGINSARVVEFGCSIPPSLAVFLVARRKGDPTQAVCRPIGGQPFFRGREANHPRAAKQTPMSPPHIDRADARTHLRCTLSDRIAGRCGRLNRFGIVRKATRGRPSGGYNCFHVWLGDRVVWIWIVVGVGLAIPVVGPGLTCPNALGRALTHWRRSPLKMETIWFVDGPLTGRADHLRAGSGTGYRHVSSVPR